MLDAIKAFFIYILKWLGLIGVTFLAFGMIVLFFTETSGMWGPSESQVVEDKFMHKGLYFSKQYYIELSNGETHSIFKRDFKELEEGDSFKPFFQSVSWKDFWLISFGVLLFFTLWICLAYFFAFLIFHKTSLFQKLEDKRKQVMKWLISTVRRNEKTRGPWKKASFLVLIIVVIIPYILIGKNVLIKVMPLGKESAIAEVDDREMIRSTGRGASSNRYTLTYTYKDKNNQSYKVKKDVSSATYDKYAKGSNIPIYYRKKFPYETFVDAQSVGEILSAVFRYSNFILLINAGLFIYLTKRFIDKNGISLMRKE